jgi:hypothetical protein
MQAAGYRDTSISGFWPQRCWLVYRRSSQSKQFKLSGRNRACGCENHSSSSGASAPSKAETMRRHQLASGSLV